MCVVPQSDIENACCSVCKVPVESQKFVSCTPELEGSPDKQAVHVTCDTCFLEYLSHHERPQSASIQIRCPAVVNEALHTNCGGTCSGADLTRLYNRHNRPGALARFIIASNRSDRSEAVVEDIARELLRQVRMRCPQCGGANDNMNKEAIFYKCTSCSLSICKICQISTPKGWYKDRHIASTHGDGATAEMIQAALRPGRWSALSHFMSLVPRDLRVPVVDAARWELLEIDEELPRMADAAVGFAFAPFQSEGMRRKMTLAARKKSKGAEGSPEREFEEMMKKIRNSTHHYQNILDAAASDKKKSRRTMKTKKQKVSKKAFSGDLASGSSSSSSGGKKSGRLNLNHGLLQRFRRGSSHLALFGRIGESACLHDSTDDSNDYSASDSMRNDEISVEKELLKEFRLERVESYRLTARI